MILKYFSKRPHRVKKIRSYHCSFKLKMKVLVFASDEFSIPSLKALYNDQMITKLEVVHPLTLTSSSNFTFLEYLIKQGTKRYNWDEFNIGKTGIKFDIGVVVSFGNIIPRNMIQYFPLEMINVHPSLLPKYRGSSPIQYCLMNGDSKTGISITTLSHNTFDMGNILLQKEYNIPPRIIYPELHQFLANEAANLLINTLHNFHELKKNAKPQERTVIGTYAKKIKVANINWPKSDSNQIYNLWRAYPDSLKTYHREKMIKILKMEESIKDITESNDSPIQSPGFIKYSLEQQLLYVKCNKGFVSISKVQYAGRREMSAKDFYNGSNMKKKILNNTSQMYRIDLYTLTKKI